MEDIELVIKIPEELYQNVLNGTYCGTLYEPLKNGTPIPKDATNGDVIKAMFPDMEEPHFYGMKKYMYDPTWWNAKYKGGG